MSRNKSKVLREITSPQTMQAIQLDLYDVATKDPCVCAAYSDTSPPPADQNEDDPDHISGGCLWEKELLKIAADEIKKIHEFYKLDGQCRLLPIARSVCRVAEKYVLAFPDTYFLPQKNFSNPLAETTSQIALHQDSSLNVLEAQSLVHLLLHSGRQLLSDFKVVTEARVAKLEKDHVEMMMSLIRGQDGKSFVPGVGLVDTRQLARPVEQDPSEQFRAAVLEAMNEQNKIRLAHPRNKTLKVTQVNIAQRLNMKRTTFETKLLEHHLSWKALKEKVEQAQNLNHR